MPGGSSVCTGGHPTELGESSGPPGGSTGCTECIAMMSYGSPDKETVDGGAPR